MKAEQLFPRSTVESPLSLFHPPAFDESKWRREVDSCDPALLFAPHYRDGSFFNPWMPRGHARVADLLRWKLSANSTCTDEEESFRPELVPNLISRIHAADQQGFIAWIGHSTFLIHMGGEYWLIDPLLSQRAFLPKRKTQPALLAGELKELPGKINVIVTHNHYDHLDRQTLLHMPQNTSFYVPLGLKDYIQNLHKGHVEEMDWWQDIDLPNGFRLVCLPAQHWSRRIGQKTNTTLWASFLLITPAASMYISGDSGYFLGYSEIGRRYPGIDYAILSTTAYHPRWFMHYVHMSAEEALDAFRDLNAKYLIPAQWGTFRLGNEPIGYPALDLLRAMRKRNLDASKVAIMDLGQILRIS
jgi:N-acyl-phosphatidylethanolamine-hydrolysing phospholipase D